jgi:YegS/Rv2252/BmrU family lipid kinase
MPKWLLAVNRSAGPRSRDPLAIRDLVVGLGVDCDLVAPESATAMTTMLVEAADAGVTHFALAGGDGTMNLAANALLTLDLDTRWTVAILPIGTGCDLLRTFGLPQDVEGAARHLLTNETYKIDVAVLQGDWGTRYFVNVAQAGVGAAAAETAPRISRRLGAARYPLAFAARLPGFPKANIRLTTERRTIESEALAVIFANAQFFAGGWNVAPKATLVDGVLDIQIINARKTHAAALVPKLIKGTHLRDKAVRRISTAEFTLETDPMWPVEADGDLVGNTSVSGLVVPAAIDLKI